MLTIKVCIPAQQASVTHSPTTNMANKLCVLAVAFGFVAATCAYPSATLVDIKQPDYQVSVKYNNGNAFEDAEVVTTTETLAIEKQVDNSTKVEEMVEEVVTEATPVATEAAPAVVTEDHELKRQVVSLGNGAVRYAFQGQTQHNEQSSSRVSHAMVRSGPAPPPTPEQPFHKVDLLPATQRGQVLAYHAGVSSTNAVTFQHLQPLPSLSPAEARLFREQIFTVNVAAPKYGYGYTVRGIERPQ